VRRDSLALYGDGGYPKLEDLHDVQTKGGWFETTLAGFAIFRREKIMWSLSLNAQNSSAIDVKLPDRTTITVTSQAGNGTSPHALWVAALWDAVTFIFREENVDMSVYDTTALANALFSMFVGKDGVRLQPCASLNVSEDDRTLYGASINTPQGPETRMISLYLLQQGKKVGIISPKYPGVTLKVDPVADSVVLDQNNQCMLLWSGTDSQSM
jgi:hypothetical protein